MGSSTDEISRQIAATREHVDENITILEQRAAFNAKRVAIMVAAGAAAGVIIGGAAFLVYRRMRKPGLSERLQSMVPDAITDLPASISSRFRGRPVRVVVQSGEKEAVWEAILRRAAPAVVTSVATAAVSRAMSARKQREA